MREHPTQELHQIVSIELGCTGQQRAPYRSNPRTKGSKLFQKKRKIRLLGARTSVMLE